MVLDGKPLPEYLVNAGVPQNYILGTTLFLLHTNDLPDDATCNTANYNDDGILYPTVIRHLICGKN